MKLKRLLFCLIWAIFILNTLFAQIGFCVEPEVGSQAAILIESSTGKILYDKNSNEILFPASLTKIMTAILVLENCNLEDKVRITESAVSLIPERLCNC